MSRPGGSAAATLRVLAPDSGDLSLDELAEKIRTTYATANRRSMEAAEAYLAVGRALAEARIRFPSDRLFGEWFGAQGFGFSQQRAWTLRQAAEHEDEVRALLTSQLVSGRTPNIESAVVRLRQRPIGGRGCTGHEHAQHPYPASGFLCLTDGADAAERVAWADYLAAVAAAHQDAERERPPGDGLARDFVEGSLGTPRRSTHVPRHTCEAALCVDISWHREKRRVMVTQLAALRAAIADEDAEIARLEAELAALEPSA